MATGAAEIFFGFSLSSELSVMTNPLSANNSLVSLAYSRSNATIQAQANIAAAADQRALVFSTLAIASAALVFGALEKVDGGSSGGGSAVFFCVSALSSTISALPGKFHGLTSKFDELREHIENETDYDRVVLGLCMNNDEYLTRNENAAGWRAHFYRFAILAFLFGILLSAYAFAS